MPRQYSYKENTFNYAVLIDFPILVSWFEKKAYIGKEQNILIQMIGKNSFRLLTGGFPAHA